MNLRNKKKIEFGQLFLHIFFIIVCLCYILPLWLLVAVSFDTTSELGFSLIPRSFSTAAYEMIFANPQKIVRAYGVTFAYSVLSVALALVMMVPIAYALSRRNFRLRGPITFILFFTTLFSGGLVPSYLLNSKLGLVDSFWIYVIPGAVSAWNIIVIRTYFQGLPGELFECARLDGASELGTCFRIAVPLSTPVLASVGFLRFIGEWNQWSTTEVYIRNPKLFSLQFLLQRILADLQVIQQMMENGMGGYDDTVIKNLESMRFAMAVVAAGPALVVFPFFQKYFKKGMTIGSVKG